MSTDYFSKIKSLGLKEKSLIDDNFSAVIEYENLKNGMGVTIGNALRRTLLSHIPGYAIKSVNIAGIQHEFTAIPGVKEDAQELIMNLKKIVFKGDVSKTKIQFSVVGPAAINASNISCSSVVVVNQDLHICYLDKGFSLKVEMLIEKGTGVRLASNFKDYDLEIEIGSINCDAFFSPIENVSFEIVPTSVNSENLRMHIVTNGSISPKEAFKYALNILTDQLDKNPFAKTNQTIVENVKKESAILNPNLFIYIDDLAGLSARTLKCLKVLGVVYIGDVVKFTKEKLMNEPHFGDTSLNKLLEELRKMGLSLGMNIPDWPPKNLEAQAQAMRNNIILGG